LVNIANENGSDLQQQISNCAINATFFLNRWTT
jgi:hypothetical protein